MYADSQINRAVLRTDIDRANVSIQESIAVDSGFFHAGNHFIVAEVAECGVVELDMACKGIAFFSLRSANCRD